MEKLMVSANPLGLLPKSRSEKKTVFNVASLMMTQGNKGAESDCVTTYLHEGAVRGRWEGEVWPGAGAELGVRPLVRLLVALHPVPDRPEVVRSLVGGALRYLEGAGPPVPLQQHQVPEEGGVGAVGVVEVLPQLLGRVVEPDVNRVLVRLVHHVDLA